jgi:DNA-binding response OmpR family regulator
MGEQILRAEGFQVVTADAGESALERLADSDPDLLLVDAFLPGLSGFDLCQRVKADAARSHVRVVLSAGMLEPFREEQAQAAGSDGTLRKPFEASEVVRVVKALAAAAESDRARRRGAGDVDAERVRAAVTLALEAAMPRMIDELTERVLLALRR